LAELIRLLPEAVALVDRDRKLVSWNRQFEALYPEASGRFVQGRMLYHVIGPPLWWTKRETYAAEDPHRPQGDGWIRHDELPMADGSFLAIASDALDEKRRETSFRLVFEAHPVPMLLAHAESLGIISANQAATERYGYELQDFLQLTAMDLYVPTERKSAAAALRAAARGDIQDDKVWSHQAASGEEILVLVISRHFTRNDTPELLITLFDVTERSRAEAHIRHLAHHDPLTGLANRFRFSGELAQALGQSMRAGDVVLLYIDLDEFKPINDTYGHAAGDMLLQLVAERLTGACGPGDVVARLGGDEFAIIITSHTGTADAEASRILTVLSTPFWVDGESVQVGVSIGVAVSEPLLDPDRMMGRADTALYRAKKAGRNRWAVSADGDDRPPHIVRH
jgi:diguanylate cyclase (GGDEF)-like protein/PAS domain S-box-containing protein